MDVSCLDRKRGKKLSNLIYRFMDFTKFVDMVIHENITLVDPLLWDDPYEKEFFSEYMRQKSKAGDFKENLSKYGYDLELILKLIVSKNIYALSWTRIEESDALWRIYSDNNQSIRIAANEESLRNLDDCILYDVNYKDFNTKDDVLNYSFYELFSTKRTAFEHEHEVRLISHLKFPSEKEKLEEYIKAYFLIYGKNYSYLKAVNKEEDIKDIVESAIKLINANSKQKIRKIPVTPIQDFIFSVMLHPKASAWQDDMVKTFCDKFGLNYLGKSNLYKID
jgi:sugar diacid utilization regulator